MATSASIESEVSSICSVDKYGFLKDESKMLDSRHEGPSPSTVIRREHKWLNMLANWNYYTTKNYNKLRNRCHKGKGLSETISVSFFTELGIRYYSMS